VGETDYCISAIPFGGYVKMAGMEGEEAFEAVEGGPVEDEELEERVPPERRFESKSVPWRLLVLSAGVMMNFLLGWAIYVGLAWREGIPTVDGTRVASVDSLALVQHPELASLPGAEIVTVDGVAVQNWYEITGTIVDGEGPVRIVLASGEEIVAQADEGSEREAVALALEPLVPAVVAQVEPGSPADQAGMRPGDRIVAIDGQETESFADVSRLVRERPRQLLPVRVERPVVGGEPTLLSLTVETGVEKAPRPSDGKFVDTGYLGARFTVGRIELSAAEGVAAGTRATLRAGTLILGGLKDLVTGGVSMRSLGGPVAIGQLTGHFARQGTASLLAWVALFSINLAILNLLPIPVLDGGHILFLGIEATRGRPLSPNQKLRLSQVGLAFLVLLMAWAFTADILRLVGL
jgi:regulator of sigma E protease